MSNNPLPLAMSFLSKKDLKDLNLDWEESTERIVGSVMRHFKGRFNPKQVRELVEEIKKELL